MDPDPKVTWAEFAQDREEDLLETLGEFCEEGYFPDPDDEVDYETLLSFHPYTVTPSYSVFFRLERLAKEIGQWSDRSSRELEQELLGYFQVIDGWGPGLDYRGVNVSSPVALACLQHSLDRVRARVRIELKP